MPVGPTASRDVIWQAKGILIERYGITSEKAFALLMTAGRHSNAKVSAVAEFLVSRGSLPGAG